MNSRQVEAAQAAINQRREKGNEIVRPNETMPWKTEVVGHLKPGDKRYLPPVTEFITVEFHNGWLTVAADYFNKLGKAKKNKLMKF